MIKYNYLKYKEKLQIFIVWHCLPKSIVYWSAIRVGANATQGDFGNQIVPELLFMDALKRWEKA